MTELATAVGRRIARLAVAGLVLVAAWWTASVALGPRGGVPAPDDVVRWWFDHRAQVLEHARQTGSEAWRGFVIGNVAALAVAGLAFLVPRIERAALSVAVLTYCLPLVAIGPLLQITLSGDAPEVTLAALSVFFTTMVGALSGLRSAAPTTVDVIRSLGGRRVAELRFVRVQAALGPTLASLRLAAPAAVLGAILGEFLGGELGVGVALVNAQKTADPVRAWAYTGTAVALAGIATLFVSVASRLLAPWQPVRVEL